VGPTRQPPAREGEAAGPSPRRRRGRACGGVLGRKAEMERKGEKEIPFPFLFLKQIFNAFPKWIFNQILIFKTLIT
jgi:hypothetical protein